MTLGYWTQVLRAQANLRETRNATPRYERRSFCARDAEPVARDSADRHNFGLQSSSTQLRVLHTTAQKIKQLPPLPLDGFKVVFRSQGGLDLTTLQPRYLPHRSHAGRCADQPIYADPPDSPCQ
ncbi:hypothetical protein MRX96_048697 [Rhipicephalus microplus]